MLQYIETVKVAVWRYSVRLINILGTNGSGKSTRTDLLVKYLDSKKTPELVMMDCKNGYKEIGRIYDSIFILGRFNKSGKWIGLDLADFTTGQSRLDLYKYISEAYPNVEIFLQEGYFNNGSKHTNKEHLLNYGVDSYSYYFFIYDNMQQFIERCNGRTGKERGEEWAINSAGWRDNTTFLKLYEYYSELNEENCIVYKCNIHAPKDLLIQELFNTTFIVEEQEIVTDEW